MITRSTQNWEPGQQVRVGFLTLIVKQAIPTPGDSRPDQYLLTNLAGDKVYAFTPHQGVRRLEIAEARELVKAAINHAEHTAALAFQKASLAAADAAELNALFVQVAA